MKTFRQYLEGLDPNDVWSSLGKEALTSPQKAYHYAADVIKARWPEGEDIIKTDPKWSYYYAKQVIKGKFPPTH